MLSFIKGVRHLELICQKIFISNYDANKEMRELTANPGSEVYLKSIFCQFPAKRESLLWESYGLHRDTQCTISVF